MKNFKINFRYSATGEISSYACKADNAYEARKKFQRQPRNPYGGRRIFIEIVQIQYINH